ncbi:MAG TPA: FimV/HubP family polar landmark protein [Lysobacter sp.]|nr:FimV/HubP family polar landmark protein [Lysobacter sp.]
MRTALAVALAVASGSAAALGLGQIELKSKLGEPLLAEIPIISSDPSELEHLRAGLASPETFARVGLGLPQGVMAQLRFVPALDQAGRPVIRVTSEAAIDEPLLTFLIEVDWGQGRLVREYSTLLDAPRTVSAPLQPPIDAPMVGPSNAIVREPVPQEAVADSGAESPLDAGVEASDREDTPLVAVPATPVAAPAAAPALIERPDRSGAVQAGDNLSTIASRLGTGGSLNQTMIALLQANPEAFIDGNIHLLKQGAVLRVPDAAEVRGIDAAQAMAQVREQTRAWRAARQPVPQPQLVGGDEATATTAATTAASGNDGARLEIVPPGASDASRAGTQSGISAGGEGDMVRQELQTTKETLAARDAELAEMKSRIEALEQLQADQQKLISMKDSELTAAQQQLAQTQAADAGESASTMPWLLGGGGLVLALLGGWWLRRRADMAPRFRAPPPTQPGRAPSTLAAGFPQANRFDDEPSDSRLRDQPEVASSTATSTSAQAERLTSPAPPASADAGEVAASPAVQDVADVAVPAWHATSGANKLNRLEPTPASATATTLADSAPVAGDADFETEAPGLERLELARAYLDLGDRESARQLLGELVIGGSPAAREQAAKLLRDIG